MLDRRASKASAVPADAREAANRSMHVHGARHAERQ
jgi:hypothetical protein